LRSCAVAATIPVFSSTYDEPFHLAAAVGLYDMHKHVYGTEHGPLPRLVAGLPLWISGVHLPERYRTTAVEKESTTCEAGTAVLFESPIPYRQVLHRARCAMLVFPAVVLLYLYLIGRWIGGEVLGALAVVFASFDPTLLGHSMWVCTDVPAASGIPRGDLSRHALDQLAQHWTRLPSSASALAMAVSCKFTCLLILPALAIVAIARSWASARRDPSDWRVEGHRSGWKMRFVAQVAIAALVAFVALWATYLFDVGPIANQQRFTPDHEWRLIPQRIKDTPVPMPSLWLGLLWFADHAHGGHPAYLNGVHGRRGRWLFFPEAIALKSPIGLLAAAGVALVVGPWCRNVINPLAKGGADRRYHRCVPADQHGRAGECWHPVMSFRSCSCCTC
jgi:dolichyl-phosphate-mannose--protein O-mannosyl transferase